MTLCFLFFVYFYFLKIYEEIYLIFFSCFFRLIIVILCIQISIFICIYNIDKIRIDSIKNYFYLYHLYCSFYHASLLIIMQNHPLVKTSIDHLILHFLNYFLLIFQNIFLKYFYFIIYYAFSYLERLLFQGSHISQLII